MFLTSVQWCFDTSTNFLDTKLTVREDIGRSNEDKERKRKFGKAVWHVCALNNKFPFPLREIWLLKNYVKIHHSFDEEIFKRILLLLMWNYCSWWKVKWKACIKITVNFLCFCFQTCMGKIELFDIQCCMNCNVHIS